MSEPTRENYLSQAVRCLLHETVRPAYIGPHSNVRCSCVGPDDNTLNALNEAVESTNSASYPSSDGAP